VSNISIPALGNTSKNSAFDSLYTISKTRLVNGLSSSPGFADGKLVTAVEANAKNSCGAKWFANQKQIQVAKTINCGTAASIIEQLKKNDGSRLTINLTATNYNFTEALFTMQDVTFTSKQKTPIKFNYSNTSFLVQVKAGSTFTLKNIDLDLAGVHDFIITDTSGSSNHSNFAIRNSDFANLNGTFFTAAKSSVADSIVISNCTFSNNKGSLFRFDNETTNKGLYNVEILKISNNKFLNGSGQILNMLRGGNDESTMGPYLIFSKNIVENYLSADTDGLIHLFGSQRSAIEKNNFKNCNPGKTLIKYDDLVRAVHYLRNNNLLKSGAIITNKFVSDTNNVIQQ
jgi:poly(beta-D-mannuronate) lyase